MRIIIIGCGPAGMMCAVECSKNSNNDVIMLEGNDKVGKKLYITGKGRCNVCNNTDANGVINNVVNNPKFLYTAINNFGPQDVINFFENNNLKLKTERGNRVFPVSDKASDVSKVFLNILKKQNVKIIYNQKVLKIVKNADSGYTIYTQNNTYKTDCVVIATGGKSYSSTGSNGDGYKFAKMLNINVNPIKPALVPIKLNNYNGELAGLSLKNISINYDDKSSKNKISLFGEMLFTHTGVSGPIVLSLSSLINNKDLKQGCLFIDLKPALTFEQLNNRLLRDFETFKNKSLKNYLKELLPQSLIEYFLKECKISGETSVCNINKEQRKTIIENLKHFNLSINKLEDVEYGIVTSGGVDVKEINPKTMESKNNKGLFFVGEVLDVDALTGGYNIQIALSTGYCAGNYLYSLT